VAVCAVVGRVCQIHISLNEWNDRLCGVVAGLDGRGVSLCVLGVGGSVDWMSGLGWACGLPLSFSRREERCVRGVTWMCV